MAAAAAAVLTAAGMVVTVLAPDSPAVAHPVNAADFQRAELARSTPSPLSGQRDTMSKTGHPGERVLMPSAPYRKAAFSSTMCGASPRNVSGGIGPSAMLIVVKV